MCVAMLRCGAGGEVRPRSHTDRKRIEQGPSFGPEVVRASRLSDRVLGTDFGDFDTGPLRPTAVVAS